MRNVSSETGCARPRGCQPQPLAGGAGGAGVRCGNTPSPGGVGRTGRAKVCGQRLHPTACRLHPRAFLPLVPNSGPGSAPRRLASRPPSPSRPNNPHPHPKWGNRLPGRLWGGRHRGPGGATEPPKTPRPHPSSPPRPTALQDPGTGCHTKTNDSSGSLPSARRAREIVAVTRTRTGGRAGGGRGAASFRRPPPPRTLSSGSLLCARLTLPFAAFRAEPSLPRLRR